jgi:hypothetical protein
MPEIATFCKRHTEKWWKGEIEDHGVFNFAFFSSMDDLRSRALAT